MGGEVLMCVVAAVPFVIKMYKREHFCVYVVKLAKREGCADLFDRLD